MQNTSLLKKYSTSVLSLLWTWHLHYGFVSTAGGGLLRKAMNQPTDGIVEIPQTHL